MPALKVLEQQEIKSCTYWRCVTRELDLIHMSIQINVSHFIWAITAKERCECLCCGLWRIIYLTSACPSAVHMSGWKTLIYSLLIYTMYLLSEVNVLQLEHVNPTTHLHAHMSSLEPNSMPISRGACFHRNPYWWNLGLCYLVNNTNWRYMRGILCVEGGTDVLADRLGHSGVLLKVCAPLIRSAFAHFFDFEYFAYSVHEHRWWL